MGSGYLVSPLMLIINTLFDLYILLVLLRFLLQMVRADFFNPVSQFIERLTIPPRRLLRRFIPNLGGQETASIVLCLHRWRAGADRWRQLCRSVCALYRRPDSTGADRVPGRSHHPGHPQLGKPRSLQPGHRPGQPNRRAGTKADPKVHPAARRARPDAPVRQPASAGGKDADHTADYLPRQLLAAIRFSAVPRLDKFALRQVEQIGNLANQVLFVMTFLTIGID